MKALAYTELPARAVADACLSWVQDQEKEVARRREAVIEEQMKLVKRWFGRSFTRTREEAIAYCENSHSMSDYHMAKVAWSGTRKEIEEVGKAALLAEPGNIFISSNVAAQLLEYMKTQK